MNRSSRSEQSQTERAILNTITQFFLFSFIFLVLGMEPRVLQLLSTYCTTKLHLQSLSSIFFCYSLQFLFFFNKPYYPYKSLLPLKFTIIIPLPSFKSSFLPFPPFIPNPHLFFFSSSFMCIKKFNLSPTHAHRGEI
jgi:hypothetical protein